MALYQRNFCGDSPCDDWDYREQAVDDLMDLHKIIKCYIDERAQFKEYLEPLMRHLYAGETMLPEHFDAFMDELAHLVDSPKIDNLRTKKV